MPIPWDIAAGAFGITSAIVLAGGIILLRYQRDRYQFQLLHAALDKGITSLPNSVPAWLLSLRQGVLTLVLGLGLVGSGAALHFAARHILEIPASATMPDRAPRPPRNGPPDAHFPGPPGPPAPPGAPGGPQDPDRPPPPSPEMQRWHRIETQRLTGLIALCCGIILALLGLVRIAFARTERKYTT
jgi:hypothetical protein